MPTSSPFWGPNYALQINRNPRRNPLRRASNRESFRQTTALFNALIGIATGGASGNVTHKRIAPAIAAKGGGGRRAIDAVVDINRNTTAADVAMLKEMLVGVTTRPATYPRDKSGNGGKAFT